MAEAVKQLKEIGALVDRGGVLDEDVKAASKELGDIKNEVLESAKGTSEDGVTLTLVGNTHQAVIAFTADIEITALDRGTVEAVDTDAAKKLFPYDVVEAHHEYTGDEDAVKELKKADVKLYKRIFKRVPQAITSGPNVSAIRKVLGSDTKKGESLREVLMQFVKDWLPKSVAFTRLK